MARTAVPLVRQARNTQSGGGTLAAPAGGGLAIDQANGMKISGHKDPGKVMIVIYNSKAGNIQTTIAKGAYPPSEDSGLGDLVRAGQVTVTFDFITGLDDRVVQANGDINIDWDAAATGVIWAYEFTDK